MNLWKTGILSILMCSSGAHADSVIDLACSDSGGFFETSVSIGGPAAGKMLLSFMGQNGAGDAYARDAKAVVGYSVWDGGSFLGKLDNSTMHFVSKDQFDHRFLTIKFPVPFSKEDIIRVIEERYKNPDKLEFFDTEFKSFGLAIGSAPGYEVTKGSCSISIEPFPEESGE